VADLPLQFYRCGWEGSVGYGVNTALEVHMSEGMSMVTRQPSWQGETHTWVSHFSPHLLFSLLFFTEELVWEVYSFASLGLLR